MLVMNASSQEQSVRVYGSWFTFKPDQIKDMNEDKGMFLTIQCNYLGFVGLPDAISEDLEFKNSEEGQRIIAEAKKQGVKNRIQYLERLKQNELVALQRDIDRAGLKYNARLEMSDGMMQNLEELASYKTKQQDENQDKLDRISEIEKLLGE